MDRHLFATRLREAAMAARDFARRFIEEPLPDELRYRLRLNRSYDGEARVGDEVVYPEDSTCERAEAVRDCSEARVVDVLWRDGRVPEWIDVSVLDALDDVTLVELMCCGRFTADEQRLYHVAEGRPPFHMTSPTLPPRYQDGERFSIHLRSECWTREDITRLGPHASRVWSLALQGRAMDDRALSQLPVLPRLEILELGCSPLRGIGLRELARHDKLRVLRIRLDRNDDVIVPSFRAPRGLTYVDLANLPGRPWGSDRLLRALPPRTTLTLHARDELHLDGDGSALGAVTITAKRVSGSFRPPARSKSVTLHVSEMTEAEVSAWLGGRT
ncbi:MAG: hypothetical protein ACM31C_31025 [Acidobacteriota bacterium]